MYILLIIKSAVPKQQRLKFNSVNIMSNKTRSHNDDEQPQPKATDDKVNIAIPRRMMNFFTQASTQISVLIFVNSFSAYLPPSAQPKQLSVCSPPIQLDVVDKSSDRHERVTLSKSVPAKD